MRITTAPYRFVRRWHRGSRTGHRRRFVPSDERTCHPATAAKPAIVSINVTGSSSANNEGGVSFATVTYGDPLLAKIEKALPTLSSYRENRHSQPKMSASASRATKFDDDKDVAESDDDQRRRSTDTLRRVEGALEQALESVEVPVLWHLHSSFSGMRTRTKILTTRKRPTRTDTRRMRKTTTSRTTSWMELSRTTTFNRCSTICKPPRASLEAQARSRATFSMDPSTMGWEQTPGAPGPSTLGGNDLSLYPDLDRSPADGPQIQSSLRDSQRTLRSAARK